jgi:beta-glucosidase
MTRDLIRPKTRAILEDPAFSAVLSKNFSYGSATAAYQIEGAKDADGKGPSVWDECLRNQDNGDVACDSYHQWTEDIKLLKEYGCNTYRFSISWPRVKPQGGRNDPVNEAGIMYYNTLVRPSTKMYKTVAYRQIDALLEAGITPWVTIFHWDHPAELESRYGGFSNTEEIVQDFLSYAQLCFQRFGDRVQNWITINEV